jgi:hypothetical protein
MQKVFNFVTLRYSSLLQNLLKLQFNKSILSSVSFLVILTNTLLSQIPVLDPLPAKCGLENASTNSAPTTLLNCANTSSLWSSDTRHIPRTDAGVIKIHANIIVIQRSDGSGNFQETGEDMAFLTDWFNTCNDRLSNLSGTSSCTTAVLAKSAKVQIVPYFVFYKDEADGFNWNNDNEPSMFQIPYHNNNWWLDDLDSQIRTLRPDMPSGINVYITVDGSIYNEMVVLGTVNNPNNATGGMKYWWSGIQPNQNNLLEQSRIHVPNLYLKYWWFKNDLNTPFSTSRQWLVGEGIVLAHEFGHTFISCYVHKNDCTNHLMTTSGGQRDVLLEGDAGCIHRNLAISNLRQYVDCSETYGSPLSDRIVTTNEKWDLNMRLYSNTVVKTGATLTITCKLLLPLDGLISVERGAKLVVDGGEISRANTCTPTEFWNTIAVSGNGGKVQANATSVLVSDDAGVVILKNKGRIEGAKIGVTTIRQPFSWESDYFGGLIDVNDFTFQDCQTGTLLMPYKLANKSKFTKANYIRTGNGYSTLGAVIFATNGIQFEECTFNDMEINGIRSWDASFNVTKKNKFIGSQSGILSGGSSPLSGQIQIGILGLIGDDRNKFEDNIVGIRATSNSKISILSNYFRNKDFGVSVNGATQSILTENTFEESAAGNKFEYTGNLGNQNLCNVYNGNTVGTNIEGVNSGFQFLQENFNTGLNDLYIEGNYGAARYNFFTPNKTENIKSSNIPLNNYTNLFFYYHQNTMFPVPNPRLKPTCAVNDCSPGSNFYNIQTNGNPIVDCMLPDLSICKTKPCLDAIRSKVLQKTNEFYNNPTLEIKGDLEGLITEREFLTEEIIREYIVEGNWNSIENLLNEDLNEFNLRRLIAVKLEQNEFNEAKSLLNSFPQENLDDQYFVTVQDINRQRLSQVDYKLNEVDLSILQKIAVAPSQESGYAQSLLGILTGQVFMPNLPNLIGSERNNFLDRTKESLTFLTSPNPVNDILKITFPEQLNKGKIGFIELKNLTGHMITSILLKEDNEVFIPVEKFPSGIYVIILKVNETVISHQKIVIQH